MCTFQKYDTDGCRVLTGGAVARVPKCCEFEFVNESPVRTSL